MTVHTTQTGTPVENATQLHIAIALVHAATYSKLYVHVHTADTLPNCNVLSSIAVTFSQLYNYI